MARGVNKVILVGTCGQDPEVRYLPNGNAVTNLSLATSEQWTDKQSGQKVERTEWHRVSLFGKVDCTSSTTVLTAITLKLPFLSSKSTSTFCA